MKGKRRYAQLTCVYVFAYVKIWFSHDTACIMFLEMQLKLIGTCISAVHTNQLALFKLLLIYYY